MITDKENKSYIIKNLNNSSNNLQLPKIYGKASKLSEKKINISILNNKKGILSRNNMNNNMKKRIRFLVLDSKVNDVKNLDINVKIKELLSEEYDSQKVIEEINRSKDVKIKRLDKAKFLREEESSIIISKDEIKYLEKQLETQTNECNKIKNEYEAIGNNIINLMKQINDYNLELYILNKYRSECYKNYASEVEEKRLEVLNKIQNNLFKNKQEYDLLQSELSKRSFDKESQFKNEVVAKLRYIKEQLEKKKEELKQEKEKQKNAKLEECKIRTKISETKKKLGKLYHLLLYEGLDFHNDGLSSIIRSIWKMGIDVDMKFFPTYLDPLLIDFLFEHAKQFLQVNNLKQQIELKQKKFSTNIHEWSTINDYNFRKDSSLKASNSDSNLFQTKVNSFRANIPKSTKFLNNYFKKHNFSPNSPAKNDMSEYKKLVNNKKLMLPNEFMSEMKNIEKEKIKLKTLQSKIRDGEKSQIRRICREFISHNYKELYQVCPYIIICAICGSENKEEGFNYYTKVEKEIISGKKIIRFFSFS